MTEDLLGSHIDEIASACVPLPLEHDVATVEQAVKRQIGHLSEGIIPVHLHPVAIELSVGRTLELHDQLLSQQINS